MIGVTHLFGCNENKPIDGAFSHRPRATPPPQPHILSLYPSYKWQTDSGSGDIAAASGRAGAQCLCACVQTCQPVTLHILLMCMTELSPLAAPTS